MLYKANHCIGDISANTKPHQLCWDDWERETAHNIKSLDPPKDQYTVSH